MLSDAEVVEVLAEWFLGADWHKGTSANEISSEALAALRAAGYAVVKAGELEALAEAGGAAVMALGEEVHAAMMDRRPGKATRLDQIKHTLAATLIPFTKDPTHA